MTDIPCLAVVKYVSPVQDQKDRITQMFVSGRHSGYRYDFYDQAWYSYSRRVVLVTDGISRGSYQEKTNKLVLNPDGTINDDQSLSTFEAQID